MDIALMSPANVAESCPFGNEPRRNSSRARRSSVSWRKVLLLKRAALARLWSVHFPKHDFGTGRLGRYSLNTFEHACDQAEAAAKKRPLGADVERVLRARKILGENASLE